jgi:hypothetical protein
VFSRVRIQFFHFLYLLGMHHFLLSLLFSFESEEELEGRKPFRIGNLMRQTDFSKIHKTLYESKPFENIRVRKLMKSLNIKYVYRCPNPLQIRPQNNQFLLKNGCTDVL